MTLYYTAVLKSMATCHHIMPLMGQGNRAGISTDIMERAQIMYVISRENP